VRFAQNSAEEKRAHELTERIYTREGYIESRLDVATGRTIIFLNNCGAMVGTTTIYSAEDGFQIEKYFAIRKSDFLPTGWSGDDIFEIGRTAKSMKGGTGLFFLALMAGIGAHAERVGARGWTAIMRPPLLGMFERHGGRDRTRNPRPARARRLCSIRRVQSGRAPVGQRGLRPHGKAVGGRDRTRNPRPARAR